MRLKLCWLAVMASACGPPADTSALLLLDPDARAAGLSLSLGGWTGSPRTPISVNEVDEVAVTGNFGVRRIALRAGHLGLVVGSVGSIDWRDIDGELDGDALDVSGAELAASSVAATLEATVTPAGPGRWRVHGPDALRRSAWLASPEGLDEVHPVALALAVFPPAAFHTLDRAAMVLVNDVVAFVGVYRSQTETLVLDASGGFTVDGPDCAHASGHFRVEGGAVVLVPEQGPARQLPVEGDALQGFAPLEEA